jgi:hypothetical protein
MTLIPGKMKEFWSGMINKSWGPSADVFRGEYYQLGEHRPISSVIVLFVSFPMMFCLTQEKWKINDQVVSGVNPAYMEVSSRCFKSFVYPSVIHADST